MKYIITAFIIALLVAPICMAKQDDASDQQTSAAYARQLSSSDAAVRQSAAEGLGRLVALDQKKLVEGYFLQEKNSRVRLALTWALYRMGKSSMLFQLVRELDSSRHDQAVGYLSQLESPEPLYAILKQENTRPKTVIGVIEVLGRIGDNEALQQIKPFEESFDPRIAEAARESSNQIQQRLGEVAPTTKSRPRTANP